MESTTWLAVRVTTGTDNQTNQREQAMSCSCGSHTMKAGSARYRDGPTTYDLSFGECSACGRVGGEMLFRDDRTLAVSRQARELFQSLKAGEAIEEVMDPQPVVEVVTPPAQSSEPEPVGQPIVEPSPVIETDLDRTARSSEFHPYKLFMVEGGPTVKTLLIKAPRGPHIATCPELGLHFESEDYLDAVLKLSAALPEALGFPAGTIVATTCTRPFLVDSVMTTAEDAEEEPTAAPAAPMQAQAPAPETAPETEPQRQSEPEAETNGQFALF